jgi:hypothetical protein
MHTKRSYLWGGEGGLKYFFGVCVWNEKNNKLVGICIKNRLDDRLSSLIGYQYLFIYTCAYSRKPVNLL